MNILLVEEDEKIIQHLKNIFISETYFLGVANTGKMAYELLDDHPYNIIILDLYLSDIKGIDFLKEIRKSYNQSELPIIVLSSGTNENEIAEVIISGANDFISKPINDVVVKHKIKNLIQLQQTYTELKLSLSLQDEHNKQLQTIIDNLPIIAMVVDENFKVQNINKTASGVYQKAKSNIDALFGEVFNCVNQISQKITCGKTTYCQHCIVRKTVSSSLKYKKNFYKEEGTFIINNNNQLSEELILEVSTTNIIYEQKNSILLCINDITTERNALIKIATQYSELLDINNRLKEAKDKYEAQALEFKQLSEYLNLVNNNLQKSEEKLRAIFDNANTGISITDINGRYLNFNSLWCNMLGYTDLEMKQLSISDITYPDDIETTKLLISNILSRKINKYKIEKRYIRKDKTVFWGEVSVSPIYNEDNNLINVIGIVTDINDKKKNEFKIIEQNEKLKELIATKDKFISIIAHDLRNPFNSLIGFSDILKANLEVFDNKKIRKFVEIINATSKNTFALLENLLTWTKSQQGTLAFTPSKIILNNIIADCCSLVKSMATAKNITLEIIAYQDFEIMADSNMLKTVIRNLLTNAIKFTLRNGIVKISVESSGNSVIIKVSDNGLGMTEDVKNSLFKIGGNKSTEGTEGEYGTGLGLILCKEFIEKHGGKIWAESELGTGSDFCLTLPVN